MNMDDLARMLLLAQGIYFSLTGIWPLISIQTFMKVTGPKRDQWLVKTVGALILVIGVVMCVAGFRGATGIEMIVLAAGSAAALAAVDIHYSTRRVIAKIYLADAVLEILLVLAWMAVTPFRS